MKLFIPITKVDVAKREVWGRAVQEVPDKSREIFDYESSKPLFEAWSSEFEKATDGKSLGNIRAMHGKVAAGKVVAIDFNDADKAIDIGAKIVDDAEWAKVEEGVYTGFSIGGSYVRKWKDETDPTLTRYTAQPSETSLVDNPCVPTARFAMIKADGAVEEREFKIAKGMYGVSTLAELLERVKYLADDAQWEAFWEGDGSNVPAQLRDWLKTGGSILAAMVAEEAAELAQAPDTPGIVALAAPTGDVAKIDEPTPDSVEKAGARHSKADMDRVQAVHDHAVGLGASCDAEKSAGGDVSKVADDELQKRLDDATSALEKLTGEIATLTAERETLTKRVEALEKQPAPAKGAVRDLHVVTKADDGAAESDPPSNDPIALMKAAQARPIAFTKF